MLHILFQREDIGNKYKFLIEMMTLISDSVVVFLYSGKLFYGMLVPAVFVFPVREGPQLCLCSYVCPLENKSPWYRDKWYKGQLKKENFQFKRNYFIIGKRFVLVVKLQYPQKSSLRCDDGLNEKRSDDFLKVKCNYMWWIETSVNLAWR